MSKNRPKKKKGLGKDGLSKYAQKKLEQAKKNYTSEAQPTHQDTHEQQEYFTPEKSSIPTLIRYTTRQENSRGIVLKPQRKNRKISSLSIIVINGVLSYGAKRQFSYDREEYPTIHTNFQTLYDSQWITENREAQNELYAIEKTIEAKIEQIEKHLRRRL